jgi:small-conductance mechanosensitive channel
MAAARHRATLFVGIGVALALVMLVLSSEFVTLHCVVLAALVLAAALSCAWVAIPLAAQSARRAGMLGGTVAALAYVLPFVGVFVYRIFTIDAATASRMAGELSASQATSLVQQGILPGVEYFRGQFLSYAVGYLLFGLAFGTLLGALGGILATRTGQRGQRINE